MNINIKSILTLDDENKYVVVAKVLYKNAWYYYIADIEDNTNLKVCLQTGENLVKVNDENLLKELAPLFVEQINNK